MAADTDIAALDEYYATVEAADLRPLWTQEGLLPSAPPIADIPYCWRWKVLRALAARAGELVPIERGGDRRVLALTNPGLGGAPYATTTLWAAVQYLGPGEFAPAHRHTPAAVRFVLEGTGVWTLVDGDPVTMTPGDLVLTPSWCWHEHHSVGDAPMLWFDGLDLPMVRALDGVFFEPSPSRDARRDVDPISASELDFGRAGLVAEERDSSGIGGDNYNDNGSARGAPTHSPLLAYRWSETDAFLQRAVAQAPDGHAAVRFTDPTTGRDALPTMRCAAHRVVPGHRTPTTRRTGSSVWVTFAGEASMVVSGTRYVLGPGDMVAVPSWAPVDIEAQSPSTFFTISDAPVIEALHLARSETLPPQEVSAESIEQMS